MTERRVPIRIKLDIGMDIKELAKRYPNMCRNYVISRIDRKKELIRGEGNNGTMGYEYLGCYDPNKLVKNCHHYAPLKDI